MSTKQVTHQLVWSGVACVITLLATIAAVADGPPTPSDPADDLAAPVSAPDPAALAALADANASVTPLYAGSPLLSIAFPSGPGEVTDETLQLVLAVAPNVAWLDLGRTSVTDAGVRLLAGLPNLSRLHLEKTAVTDAAIGSLAGLKRLKYLNLYGAKVGNPGLAELAALPKLSRLYVWQTGVTFDAAKELEAATPGLTVNLGWDHPGVVRNRLQKELDRVANDRAAAEQKATAAEKQLVEAKQQLEAATARVRELKAELESLQDQQ